ncbi:hypothetical protein ACFE04_010995 [Oxalis oulophora]
MAMRSSLSGLAVNRTRLMDSTRGSMSRFFSDKGRVLSEEERAKETVYIQKMEKERLEKLKLKAEKEKAAKEKEASEKLYLHCRVILFCRNLERHYGSVGHGHAG